MGLSGRFEWETILRRTICEGNMDKVADLSRETILRRTICEGNMGKMADLSGKTILRTYHLRGKHGLKWPI